MWRMNLSDSVIAETFAKFIADEGVKSAHVLAVNNDFGRGAAAVYQKALPEHGVKFNGADFFAQGTNDLRNIIGKITAQSPDAILLFGEPPDCALLARQRAELKLNVRLYARGGCYTDEALKLMGDPSLGNGLTEAAYWARTDDQPMVEEYKKLHGDYPPYNAALAYYAMMTVDQALRAGGASTDGITQGLAKVDWKSAIGRIKFDDHHQAYPNLFLVRIENGVTKVLRTVETTR
jgi:branched-chain amino acid transport system substrate-binding protein